MHYALFHDLSPDLLIVLHPYYKPAYIQKMWGGADEQMAEIAAGNLNAVSWQDKVHKVIEKVVSVNSLRVSFIKATNIV